MAIIVTFQNPEDSPTGGLALRLRYTFEAGKVLLKYAHGRRKFTREDWHTYARLGATITVSTPQESNIVKTVLGIEAQKSLG